MSMSIFRSNYLHVDVHITAHKLLCWLFMTKLFIGMERHEQVSALELFRDGEYKVIMATTVAEEGLDIKECNLVVRYDYAGSPVAMMQARGTSSLLFDIIRHVDMNT